MFDGDVAIVAEPGVTPINDDESTYGVTPPLIVKTTLRSLHCLFGIAATAGRPNIAAVYTGCTQPVSVGLRSLFEQLGGV